MGKAAHRNLTSNIHAGEKLHFRVVKSYTDKMIVIITTISSASCQRKKQQLDTVDSLLSQLGTNE